MKKLLCICFIIWSALSIANAQLPLPLEEQIASSLLLKYDKHFLVGGSEFDSLIGKYGFFPGVGEEITDPYHTLYNVVWFDAVEADSLGELLLEFDSLGEFFSEGKHILGLYRNGQILWDTGPTIPFGGNGVYGASDINNDGTVDILIPSRDAEFTYYLDRLWILSWDGTIGRIINEVDTLGQSTLLSPDKQFRLMDIEGDGILEI